MTRKSALSLAFALTALVTMAVVTLSVRAGFFGLGRGDRTPSAAAQQQQAGTYDPVTGEWTESVPPAGPDTQYVTEYVYYDDGTRGPAPNDPNDAGNNEENAGAGGDSDSPGSSWPTATPRAAAGSTPKPTLTSIPTPTKKPTIAQPGQPTATPHRTTAPTHAPVQPTHTPTPRPQQTPPPQPAGEAPTPTPYVPPHEEEPETPDAQETPEPHETTEPHETQEPWETPEPHDTPKPWETPEPHDTPEPHETAEPHDD